MEEVKQGQAWFYTDSVDGMREYSEGEWFDVDFEILDRLWSELDFFWQSYEGNRRPSVAYYKILWNTRRFDALNNSYHSHRLVEAQGHTAKRDFEKCLEALNGRPGVWQHSPDYLLTEFTPIGVEFLYSKDFVEALQLWPETCTYEGVQPRSLHTIPELLEWLKSSVADLHYVVAPDDWQPPANREAQAYFKELKWQNLAIQRERLPDQLDGQHPVPEFDVHLAAGTPGAWNFAQPEAIKNSRNDVGRYPPTKPKLERFLKFLEIRLDHEGKSLK